MNFEIKKLILTAVFFAFILSLLLSNDVFLSLMQSKLYDNAKIGKTIIKKPNDWLLYYKKETGRRGLFYGFIPGDLGTSPCEEFFVYKKIKSNSDIVFCSMKNDFFYKGRVILEAIKNNEKDKYEFLFKKIKEFDGLVSKSNNNLSINIPYLEVYVITNDLQNLESFAFLPRDDNP